MDFKWYKLQKFIFKSANVGGKMVCKHPAETFLYTHTHTRSRPTHRAAIHFSAPCRSSCKTGLNKQTHSFLCGVTLTFSYRASNDSWCVKRLSQSVCPEAPGVLSGAHRLPGSRGGGGEETPEESRELLRSAADCGGKRGRDKTKVTTQRWGRKKYEKDGGEEKRQWRRKESWNGSCQLKCSGFAALPIDLASSDSSLTLRPQSPAPSQTHIIPLLQWAFLVDSYLVT